MQQAPTISEWLFKGGLYPDPLQLELLWKDVQSCLRGDYDHIYRAFIKMEPHKRSKADEGRWRLIIQSSMCMQVAWRMAVGHQEDAFLNTMGCHPSAYGEVWFGGGWKKFLSRCERLKLDFCLDKSAWDWNSPGYVYQDIKELRKRLTINPSDEWESLMDRLYEDAYVSSRVLVGSNLYQQTTPGLMKSGLLVTISDNSIAQVLLDRYVAVRLKWPYRTIVATGDDTIQRMPQDVPLYISTIQSFGCVVKEQIHGVEFMGTDFSAGVPIPLYGGKHLKNIQYVQDEDIDCVLDSYMRNYAHSTVFRKFWRTLAVELGAKILSDRYYLWFHDNPEALERGRFAQLSYGNHADRSRGEAMVV